MKDVEYFTFMMPPSIWKKKPHPSSFKMDIEYAAKVYPGATPILSSREVRRGVSQVTSASPYCQPSRLKTPEEEALSAWLMSRIGEKSERLD